MHVAYYTPWLPFFVYLFDLHSDTITITHETHNYDVVQDFHRICCFVVLLFQLVADDPTLFGCRRFDGCLSPQVSFTFESKAI